MYLACHPCWPNLDYKVVYYDPGLKTQIITELNNTYKKRSRYLAVLLHFWEMDNECLDLFILPEMLMIETEFLRESFILVHNWQTLLNKKEHSSSLKGLERSGVGAFPANRNSSARILDNCSV